MALISWTILSKGNTPYAQPYPASPDGQAILQFLLTAEGQPAPTVMAAASMDYCRIWQGRASAIATLKIGDNFAKQFEYKEAGILRRAPVSPPLP